jgi:uncharacterized protein (TIGR03437 family)
MKKILLSTLYRTFAAALFAGLLSAQVQFTMTPNPVVFAAVPPASQQSQTITLASSVPTPISVQIPSYFSGFLSVSNVPAATVGNPPIAQFTLTVDTHGLAASTLPYQFLLIAGATGTSNQIQVLVNVTVSGSGSGQSSQLVASPASLTFSSQSTASQPSPQMVTISSLSGSVQSYNTSATSSGWLSATPSSGNTGTANTISVSVNSAGLGSGSYDGSITITPGSGNPVTVPVHLDVTSSPQITLSRSAISFGWQSTTGLQGLPAPQTVKIDSSVANSKFFFSTTIMVDPTDPGWIVVTPTSGFTPADLQIGLNTQVVGSMSPGKHNATVYIDAAGTSTPRQAIQVSFTISTSPLLTVSPGSLAFNMAATGALPASQTVNVASTSTATPISAVFTSSTGVAWASVVVSSATNPASTPAQVQLTIAPIAQSMLAQTYTGTLTITSSSDRQDIPVTLTISNSQVLTVSPAALTFSYQLSKALPVDQSFQITSSGAPITFTASANSTGNWLIINTAPGVNLSSPASLIVSIDRNVVPLLAANTYTGSIVLTPSTGQPVTLAVTLNVSQNALLLAYPSQLVFNFGPGDSRIQRQNLSVSSTGDPVLFNVISAGGFWLSALGSTSQTTSVNVIIQVDATLLTAGSYTGVVTLIPTGAATSAVSPAISIPVKVTITAGALAVDKSGLTFTQVSGGSLPPAQTVNVTNAAGSGIGFSASVQMDNGGNWLTVTPTNGTTPQALTVSVANTLGLPAGTTYTGAVILQAPGASNSPQTIRVAFTVVAPQLITIPATPLVFTSTAGATPAAQSVSIGGSAQGMTFTATATTQTGGAWLVVAPTTGTFPTMLNVSVSPTLLASLAPGTYNGSIIVDSTGATNTPQTIPVTLVVASLAPVVSTVRNSASYQAGAIAPGEILYIEGAAMGPSTLTIATPNPAWPTTLANVQVTFDGIPAPILYVMNNKLSVVVPWAISGRLSTQMVVRSQNQASNALNLQVASVAPGLYTTDASGTGQAAILNYHISGTVDLNASNRPIERGGAIAVYGTGGGVTVPGGLDGTVTPAILYPLNATVTAFVGGQPMTVLYSGGAPGLLSGAMQINLLVPANAPTGNQPLVILVNGVPTQASATVAIQ